MPKEQATELDEQTKIKLWRLDVLKEAGISRKEAYLLAQSDSGLHQILKTYQSGCEETLLVKIFS